MKLFVDDKRTPPDETWSVARTSDEGIALLSLGTVTELSLDHDLGDEDTGYRVAMWLEERVFRGALPAPNVLLCHSSNPPGKKRIEAAFASIRHLSASRLSPAVLRLVPCRWCGAHPFDGRAVESVKHREGPVLYGVVCSCGARGPLRDSIADAAEAWNSAYPATGERGA